MSWIIRIQLLAAVPLILLNWYAGRKVFHAIVSCFNVPRRKVQWSILGVIVILNLFPIILLIGYLTGASWVQSAGRGDIRLFDWLFAYPFWTGLVTTVELCIVFFCSDVVRFAFYRIYRRDPQRWMHRQGVILLCAAIVIVVYVPIRVYHDTATISVDSIEQKISGLPSSLDSLRIVQVSDVHVDNRTKGAKLARLHELVESLNPDLVVFNGDLVSSSRLFIDEAADVIGGLSAHYGIYACLGDHDVWQGSALSMQALRRHGVIVADDSTVTVRIGGTLVDISIVTNVYADRPPHSLLGRIDSEPAGLSMLIVHQPSKWLVDSAAAHRYNIFLGGHTHGGQVALGIPWAPFIFSRIETPYVSGFYHVGSMLVSITTGIGLTGAPIRFQAPSEITCITLRRSL